MIIQNIMKYRIFDIAGNTFSVGNLIAIVVIFFISWFLIRLTSSLIRINVKKTDSGDGRFLSIIQLVKYGIWTLAVVVGLQSLGVNITFIVASSAALMVGLGFGLQNVFQDFIAGIILLIEGTIRVGDIVEVDKKVVRIKEISLRTCAVATREDNILIIPNHMFVQNSVTNWSHNLEPTRFVLKVGVSYSSDVRLVEKLLIGCAESLAEIIKAENYNPFVRFSDFGESALLFELIFWSNNLFRIENTKSNLRFKIIEEFEANGVIIPFPQIVVHRP